MNITYKCMIFQCNDYMKIEQLKKIMIFHIPYYIYLLIKTIVYEMYNMKYIEINVKYFILFKNKTLVV